MLCQKFQYNIIYVAIGCSKGRNGHIPYRDSKLTRILQNSLGGNARTAIICTVSPVRRHIEQSRNTLLFASCAKEVSTNAHVNVVMSDKKLVKHLQKELARLESELRSLELNYAANNFTALLKEKELLIEKVRKIIFFHSTSNSTKCGHHLPTKLGHLGKSYFPLA